MRISKLYGILIERHSLFHMWWTETKAFVFRHAYTLQFKLGVWLVRHGAYQCPDCKRIVKLKDDIV